MSNLHYGYNAVAKARPVYVGASAPSSLTQGTDTTPVAGTIYFGDVFVPLDMTLTGIGYLIGSVGGTDKVAVALYGETGALLGTSILDSSVTVGTTATVQEVPFINPIVVPGPGLYYAAVAVNGTTCRLRVGVSCGARGGTLAGSFNTFAAITPVVASAGAPVAYVY